MGDLLSIFLPGYLLKLNEHKRKETLRSMGDLWTRFLSHKSQKLKAINKEIEGGKDDLFMYIRQYIFVKS